MPEEAKTVADPKILNAKRLIHPVILSGGSGTRLWPMSRAAYPKQLQPLLSARSLLQDSVARVLQADLFAAPVILANEEHRFIIAEQLRQIDVKPQTIMLEPIARNTGPAAAAAALWISQRDPDALMLIMPSDHAIADHPAFLKAIETGATAAAAGKLVTFGIHADRPETGYGYIRRGGAVGQTGAFEVAAFVEKPDRERAEQYVASGDYTWNSGIFLFPVQTYLAEYKARLPESYAAVEAAVAHEKGDLDFHRLAAQDFAKAENLSIDYAVMEHTSNAAVVPVAMGWNDVGAWDALWDISPKDENQMVQIGDVVAVDCRGSYLRTEERLLAAVGVDDLIVVATADAVLVAPKSRAQDVKRLIDRMKLDKREELTHLPTVHRPWGTYRSIHNGERVQVKHIMVKPGGKLSLQMHHHRAEHWVVVSGTAKIVRGNEELLLTENQSTYIPLGTNHRLENPGRIPLHLIEVQSGSYLGEDDIVRFEDTYGRA
ncbi:mannose-1-phosphate guanylyltransferase/mannose-6-phosphate isomerase [Aliidongia dinghuensis]|uniref:mannose-1-phosphate guanylyltransferase n=1 Tax=Aliidongia dinghuensis TaxID=1867774 RepID=A0A8J2YS93_9PROT|nr:mannose-1-phosphate guanylyltransferase/mannose-6-phosphate isomerase [Aliidongia dinghuensis]GGF07954.1 mannose-1-phosphate guanylyltransferase/mannose-6-phosphate isomerase [Aliidongia dinghuensis]